MPTVSAQKVLTPFAQMKTKAYAAMAAGVSVLALGSCSSESTNVTATTTTAAPSTAASTTTTTISASADPGTTFDITAGTKAAKWGTNVTITYNADSIVFSSDGMPNHEVPDQLLIPVGPPNPGAALVDSDFVAKNSVKS
jgi:hypothetical protein